MNDNQKQHSDFLTFSRKDDIFQAEAADITAHGISFLRVEMARVRVGMNDFLMKVASPKSAISGGKSNSIITLRCNRRQASSSGALATAKTIIAQMIQNGDSTADWAKIDADHLGRMLFPTLKFFATNTNTDRLSQVTEALN